MRRNQIAASTDSSGYSSDEETNYSSPFRSKCAALLSECANLEEEISSLEVSLACWSVALLDLGTQGKCDSRL